jgi:hypothetical protein
MTIGTDKTAYRVSVNGQTWRCVQDLATSGPRDRHFTVEPSSRGMSAVRFGDGVHGARPPAGSEIAVRYRRGAGGGVTVTLHRTRVPAAEDQALWVVVRQRTDAVSFEHSDEDPCGKGAR